MAAARPRWKKPQPCSYMYRPRVWYWCEMPPEIDPSNSSGSPKSWVAPIVEMITVKTMVGRSPGRVTWMNCRQREAPSIPAASYSSCGIDCMPAR